MANRAYCSKCKFEFYAGHDHHSGSSSCLCLQCMAVFTCVTKSNWGPNFDEVVPICRTVRRKRKKKRDRDPKQVPTGTTVVACRDEESKFMIGEEISYLVYYDFESVPCPDCDSESLVAGFDEECNCPKCKVGHLTLDPIIY